jgi:hypothetical protein
MKVIILVMSCGVEDYPKLVQMQRDTWDSIVNPETQTIYYYAGHNTELLADRLIIDTAEGQGHFYIKTMKAFEYLLTLEWDYIFKTDNSAYIYKKELVKALQDKPRTCFYGGHHYKTMSSLSPPFLWGEGIAFSRDVIQYLVEDYKTSTIPRYGVEDVHIGMILQDKFPWNTSMMIHEYHKGPFIVNHVYRCKDIRLGCNIEQQLDAMRDLHSTITSLESQH